MDTHSFYTRNMLQQYGKQLVSARRLARYQQLLGRGDQQGVGPPPDVKRRLMVERIAREIVDNLIFSGSENPIVNEVRQRLNTVMGEELIFQYPPGELEFKIIRNTLDGPEEISVDEKHLVMGRLWDITLETVNETML